MFASSLVTVEVLAVIPPRISAPIFLAGTTVKVVESSLTQYEQDPIWVFYNLSALAIS
jgi:hypothetical protein